MYSWPHVIQMWKIITIYNLNIWNDKWDTLNWCRSPSNIADVRARSSVHIESTVSLYQPRKSRCRQIGHRQNAHTIILTHGRAISGSLSFRNFTRWILSSFVFSFFFCFTTRVARRVIVRLWQSQVVLAKCQCPEVEFVIESNQFPWIADVLQSRREKVQWTGQRGCARTFR